MKKYSERLVTIISAVLCLAICLAGGFIISGENTEKPKIIELRLKDDHPGIPGYDLELQTLAYYGVEGSMDRLNITDYTLSCDVKEVEIDNEQGKVIVPADFKDNTDLEGFNIYVHHKTDKSVVASYPYTIKKWNMTKSDEFDGETLDEELWSPYDSNSAEDLGFGRTKGYDKNALYLENGRLVLDYKVNDKTGTNKTATYIVGSVKSKYTQNQGLFTASIAMPTKGGALNAFWTIPTSETWGKAWFATARAGEREGMLLGENDIVEFSPNWISKATGNPQCYVTDHFWNSDTLAVDTSKQHQASYSTEKLKNGEAVEYSFAWTPVGFYYYIDGNLVRTVKNIESTEEPVTLVFQILGSDFSEDGKTVDEGRNSWAGLFTHDDILNGTMKMSVDFCRWYK